MTPKPLPPPPAEGLWTRQFGPEQDFPTTPVRHQIALCTTPRCGSHFLGHRLHATGAFGYPLEYCNPGNWERWRDRARDDRAGETLAYIKSRRTSGNGVFSIKLHHEHLALFLAHEHDPGAYCFVHLRRRDLLAQAVSFARAQQTSSWISDMPELAEARYDRDLIAAKLEAIAVGNALWDAFLTAQGITPLRLDYEDVAADPDQAVRAVAAHAGVHIEDRLASPEAFEPERQAPKTGPKEDWAARFVAENRLRMSKGQSVPGVEEPPGLDVLRDALKDRARDGLRALGLRR